MEKAFGPYQSTREDEECGLESLVPGGSERRNASVRADGDVVLLRILGHDFQRVLDARYEKGYVVQRAELASIGGLGDQHVFEVIGSVGHAHH